ncbi:flavodoxin-dependent (E)-4-hydroxy-3-methylbut-2-enyl-diphosphate synthase [Atribacter laminatus]|jgi:(E)-4-hydroxy-3-methylbut-2-enyl-diphosphate synthase|uniref:4-hydroxy-3-methylbut-2-en-1-yl diphosphate synthase (flavodoxin) n=1 Tax=Atribacter laminatus TaxID=2847778 RepID=A0A7T1ANQ2_ATRLM|nr:flavodoxin-dependent (E)-4-hydroxy-3-methylbut-2-enyl-diphosphate synthase [Atribacter laminatus]QPM69282.1 4-hydroxy-3-methylbut-2-en-1-yl diphosphate synthase (flavodoxin) [Atribacter laminatus]
MKREKTFQVFLGSLAIGGRSSVSVESMGRVYPGRVDECLNEICAAAAAGSDCFRIAVPDEGALSGIIQLKKHSPLPLVADIHFSPIIALKAVEAGIDGIRVNPGTWKNRLQYQQLIERMKARNGVLRLGANTGSLPSHLQKKGRVEALLDSIIEMIEIPQKNDFHRIILSAKSTDINETIEIYERLADAFSYPLHVGLTEAGEGFEGIIKSTIALSTILQKGIGNNIRVSLTSPNPVLESQVAVQILQGVGLRQKGIEVISCPTCARTRGDVVSFVREIKEAVQMISSPFPIKLAIMGCEVNGPGEAKEADLGLAFGKSTALLFVQGKVVKTMHQQDALSELVKQLQLMVSNPMVKK